VAAGGAPIGLCSETTRGLAAPLSDRMIDQELLRRFA